MKYEHILVVYESPHYPQIHSIFNKSFSELLQVLVSYHSDFLSKEGHKILSWVFSDPVPEARLAKGLLKLLAQSSKTRSN